MFGLRSLKQSALAVYAELDKQDGGSAYCFRLIYELLSGCLCSVFCLPVPCLIFNSEGPSKVSLDRDSKDESKSQAEKMQITAEQLSKTHDPQR